MTTLGEHVRELRIAAGLSQAQLGESAGVTGSAISQLESGLSKTLKGDTLVRLARALAVDPTRLMTDSAPKSELTDDELQLLRVYRALPSGHKDIAVRLLKALT